MTDPDEVVQAVLAISGDLVEAITELREAAYGDSNDAEIEAGHNVASIAENLLSYLGVAVPEVHDPELDY